VKPLPKADELTQPYWEHARQHELWIERCRACDEYRHPPLPLANPNVSGVQDALPPPPRTCRHCGVTDYVWSKLSGKGVVYSYIIDYQRLVPGFPEPYVVAQVVPVEAQRDTVRITANVIGCALEDVYIGMPVEVTFQDVTVEVTLPQFQPVPDAKLRSRGEEPGTP
jgi:uncharacterized OB-fold protein